MIVATAAIAHDAREGRSFAESGFSTNDRSTAAGARDTMPAKMMKLMPLPIPFSVISTPSHMRVIDAGGQGDDLGPGLPGFRVERGGQHAVSR